MRDDATEDLSVQWHWNTKQATMTYRGKSTQLPGTYDSAAEAQLAAEERARAMGWRR